MQVTVCEEAKGELRYNVYLTDRSARIQLKVDARALECVVPDSDTATGERDDIMSEDASRLLGPITDRLVISPSRTTVATMGARGGAGMMKPSLPSQGFVLKVRRKVRFCFVVRLVHTANVQPYFSSAPHALIHLPDLSF